MGEVRDKTSLLWRYAKHYRGRYLLGAAMLLSTNLCAMAIPELFRQAINAIGADATGGAVPSASGRPSSWGQWWRWWPWAPNAMPHTPDMPLSLTQIAVAMLLAAAFGAGFRTLSRLCILYAARDVEMDVRCDAYHHLTAMPPPYYQVHPVGDLLSRLTSDLTQVRLMLGPGVLNLLNTFIAYVIAVPLMLRLNVKLTLAVFCAYPFAWLLMRRMGRKMFEHNKIQQRNLGGLTAFVRERLGSAPLWRNMALEPLAANLVDHVAG